MDDSLLQGPFTRAEAVAADLSPRDLRMLLDEGVLERPFIGVYLPTAVADDVGERIRALGRLLPPGTALVRESAAWVHGVDVRPPERFRAPPVLEVASASSLALNAIRRDGVHGHLVVLPPSDLMTIAGVAVTTPSRTALDLARFSERYMGLAALDMFSNRGLVDLDEIGERIARLTGHRWIGRARCVWKMADPRAESPGESWLRLRIVEADLPLPDLQVELVGRDGHVVYRLDLGYEEARLAIEYDGVAYHYSAMDQSDRNGRRSQDIEERWRWRVRSFHAGHVLGRRPAVEEVIIQDLGLGMVPSRLRWA
ncbi:DUF559 domain-containing protein [Georgenia halophila]|uniref:DUF559 domain-containing protein n=1 Tax=Georgenia halophila TaxID=620889 RepID=A0ABP8LA90_9MICO